jgi:hypothetical protein
LDKIGSTRGKGSGRFLKKAAPKTFFDFGPESLRDRALDLSTTREYNPK